MTDVDSFMRLLSVAAAVLFALTLGLALWGTLGQWNKKMIGILTPTTFIVCTLLTYLTAAFYYWHWYYR